MVDFGKVKKDFCRLHRTTRCIRKIEIRSGHQALLLLFDFSKTLELSLVCEFLLACYIYINPPPMAQSHISIHHLLHPSIPLSTPQHNEIPTLPPPPPPRPHLCNPPTHARNRTRGERNSRSANLLHHRLPGQEFPRGPVSGSVLWVGDLLPYH